MNGSRIPTALFDEVRRDLKPVRPLASPELRALALLPIGIALLIGMPEYWSWKTHALLAPWSSWGLSTLETLLSVVILAAGLREAVPGRELSSRALTALMCTSFVSFALINMTTHSPAGTSHALWLQWLGECVGTAVTFSVPALIAPAWLVARALPNRPAVTGALCGLGVGLMADAGLRLLCWDGDYAHVLVAHGGAILILVALGALSATTVERIKARRLKRRS
jgi:hypothetical protein